MKLYYSPHSPFVRKVLVTAHELGLTDRIELLKSAAGPIERDHEIVALNPLGQVPTLLADDGTMIADSRVICEYLNALAGGGLYPADGPARWQALIDQSMADGLLAAALLCRYERLMRPAERQYDAWIEGQFAKIASALDFFRDRAAGLSGRTSDIGTISVACALSYLDHRFSACNWQEGRRALGDWFAAYAERPAMRETVLGVSKIEGM